MTRQTLQDVADWIKSTDLAKVSYRRGEDALAIEVEGTPTPTESAFPPCRLEAVRAQEVGIFRFQDIGKARGPEKGSDVRAGQTLGFITAGKAKYEVKAPAAGRIISELAEDGMAVEYGQPLFFIQP